MARVLLIDDDPHVRAALATALRHAGHEVVEAGNGSGATPATVDVCLTDVFMPGADGLEVLIRLHAEAPTLPVIVMTGDPYFRGMDVVAISRQLGARQVLLKPIHPNTLVEAVTEAAASRAPVATSSA